MGKKQYLVPYLMSSHPGSTLRDAVELALFLKQEGLHPEQVQDFYPTPRHPIHLYVLYRPGSGHPGTGVCAAHPGGKG